MDLIITPVVEGKERLHAREKTSLVGDRAGISVHQRLLPNVGSLVPRPEQLSAWAVLSARGSAGMPVPTGLLPADAGRRCAGAARQYELATLPVADAMV
jgi:hypothetical protein